VPTLLIADFNTTGLTGPAQKGTVFQSLVKGSGVSRKTSDTSGGSFGIGKNAAFAVSDLQAVFYSTRYIAPDGSTPFLAQGKVSLMSHTDAAGEPRLAEGFWGKHGFKPFETIEEVPGWLKRDEPGTTVCAVGFRNSPDWQMRIAYSLIQNFFHAIQEGAMEFSIDDGRIEINRNNLGALFADENIRAAAKENGALDDFLLSENLYNCLISSDAVESVIESAELGRVQVRVLVAEDLPKKVCIIRNGMVVTDNLSHFGETFARFRMCRDFVAVVVPLDDSGRAFIKRLENPRHDELSADRLPSPSDRAAAIPVMKKLGKSIRAIIREETKISFDDEEDADEMREYFGDDPGPDNNTARSRQDDPERISYTVEPRRTRQNPSAAAAGMGEDGGTGNRANPGSGQTNGYGTRNGGSGGKGQSRPVVLNEVRYAASGDAKARILFFTSDEGGVATISVEATGINDAVPLTVIAADGAEVTGGRLRRQVTAGERVRIALDFDEPYTGPIEVSARIEPGEAS
jgi:hypothetical protein